MQAQITGQMEVGMENVLNPIGHWFKKDKMGSNKLRLSPAILRQNCAKVACSGAKSVPVNAKGTVVKWVNDDSYAHTVTANDGTFDSGNIAGGASFSYTANTPGTFSYHCTIHGTAMSGTLIVSP